MKPLENGGLGYIPSLDYPIFGPDGKAIYPGDFHGDNGYRWVWSREKVERALKLDMITFVPSQKDKNKLKVYYKIYEYVDTDGNPSEKQLPYPTLFLDGFTNRQAINDLKRLFNGRVFDYPKPVRFIQELIHMAGDKNDSIILDFFSGSAATGQAVMQCNSEDDGSRKFIMVQLPDKCDKRSEAYKAGYANICEIGKERIRRAAKKIHEEHPDAKFDDGFRVFKVDESNMTDVYYSVDSYDQNMLNQLESNIKPDRTDLDLLFGCLIEWGLPLSMPYTSEDIEGCTVHTYNDGDLIACFNNDIPENVIKEIAKRKPLRAVFRDSGFKGSPEKINVGETFKLLSPDTRVKVI